MTDQEIEKTGFAEALAEFEQDGGETRREDPAIGDKVSGKISSIGEETAFVDLGTKAEAVMDVAQLRDAEGNLAVNVGDTVEATVASVDAETGTLTVQRRAASGGKGSENKGASDAALEIRLAWQHGIPVEGVVSGINKGGAEVQVKGVRCFCPLSQLDLRYVGDPAQFVGQRLAFRVTQFEEGKGRRPNIVLSRRAILEEDQQKRAAEARSRIAVGATMTGKVTSLATYGAFVDLGGIEGMLHVSEIGYSRVSHPKEVLSVGQEIEVQIIKIEKGKDEKKPERISLSRRSLERDPWRDVAAQFPEGTELQGKIMRTESFGAFVEIAPGIEGLLHVSELGGGRRINHAREAVQPGQEMQVRVLNVDTAKRRISLGSASGEGGYDREEETAAPARTPAPPTGSFGSMADFFKNMKRAK